MKTNFIHLALCISIVLVSASCDKNNNIDVTETDTADGDAIQVEIPKDNFYSEVHSDAIVSDNFGKYEDFLAPTDFETGIVSAKHGVANPEHIFLFDSGKMKNASTKSDSTNEQFDIFVNGVLVKAETKSTAIDLESYFGKTVRFAITPKTKSASDTCSESEIYVPQQITITAPDVKQLQYSSPVCYHKNFVLKWNKDELNENGVIVAVEWNGNMVYGDSASNTYVRNTDCVPDTGECILNEKLFKNIPDTALCNLYIVRGDVENVLVNGYSYKTSGITFEVMQFILVRRIENK